MLSPQPIFRVHCEVADILDLGAAPFGHRRVVNLLGGTVSGARLNGRIWPGGSDWQILSADGSADIHARYTVETDAGPIAPLAHIKDIVVRTGRRLVRRSRQSPGHLTRAPPASRPAATQSPRRRGSSATPTAA